MSAAETEEKKRIDLAWKQFNTLREQRSARIDGDRDIEYEKCFLVLQVKTYKLRELRGRSSSASDHTIDLRAYVDNYFRALESRHTCSNACEFARMTKAARYLHNGRTYSATGEVFVCRSSARAHLCGDRCMETVALSTGEGLVCTLTGLMLDAEYSVSDVTTGSDVRMCGKSVFRHFGMRNDGVDMSKDDSHQQDLLEKLASACSSMQDASYVLSARPGAEFSELREACMQRAEWRTLAVNTFNKVVAQGQYRDQQQHVVQVAHDRLVKHCTEYYANCARRGERANVVNVLLLWASIERPVYKGVTVGGDPQAVADRLRGRVVEAVILLWERLCELSTARTKNFKFGNCLLGMLQYMEDVEGGGLSTQLAVLHGGKPMRPSALGADELRAQVSHFVEMDFIPRVAGLKLAQPRQVRERNPTRKRRRGMTGVLESVSLVNPQRGSGCRKKKTTMRKKRTVSPQMPSKKMVSLLFDDAITSCTSITELHSYCTNTLINLNAA